MLITDKLRSYGAAKREIMPGVEHRQHKGLNNRAENSPPTDPTTRPTGDVCPAGGIRSSIPASAAADLFCYRLTWKCQPAPSS